MGESHATQGQAVDIGGYYHPDAAKVEAAMRPSEVFNGVVGFDSDPIGAHPGE